ncbi:MAG TPA: bifunctional serine/threonine-protein kinase/formylglycine-generating enzyme family protein [Gemmataceae bacterium]|nr:bifunctional serine/threonine-protein kinase/formylglycine-generating enzyme family protein [Gemmataceae bacterium]
MSWKDKVVGLYKRFGAPVKFAAKVVLGAVVPGGSAVIELVGAALDCVHETTKDILEIDEERLSATTAADLQRLEGVLDVLTGDLGALTAQMAALESLPDVAKQQLDVALATDDRCRAALGKLDGLAKGFDVLREQNSKILKGQGYAAGMLEEMLPLMRRMAGIADYVEELHAAGISGSEFRSLLAVFREGQRDLGQGRIAEARAKLSEASQARPTSGAAAVALAAVQAVGHDLPAAEQSLGRAVRLRPRDAELGELHRRVTEVSRGATPASGGRQPPDGVTAAPPKVGAVLDGWRLELLLGRGGWGQVFKATRGGEARALKVMHPELSRDPLFVERFKAEILTLGGLRGNKHLVEIHGFGMDAGCWYFLMEFIDGVSLEQYLMRKGQLSVAQAVPLFARAADGLALAHGRGVVHRDLKPANILLRKPNGQPVVVDFGLAVLAGGTGLTKTGQSAGYTPMFAAPEQLRGKPADARTDVYALGASLFYALNYDKPHLREPDQFEPEHAPEALRDALTRALQHRPEKRPANAAEFRALLQGAGDGMGRGDPAPTTATPSAGRGGVSPPSSTPVKPQRKADEVYTNSLGMKFAWIPPGTFLMGSPPIEPEREHDEVQHKVKLTKGFWMGVHQVAQAQWQVVMGSNPSHFKGDSLPVEQISWDDAAAFCEALGRKDGKPYRPPTEAEWEYACRAGTTTPFHFGSAISTNQVNYDGNYVYNQGRKGVYRQKTTLVGSFPANAWGLFDMHGNVWEWCQDFYDAYETRDDTDPQGAGSEGGRVLRGGSWDSYPCFCRAAFRGRYHPDRQYGYVGCRVVQCLD